MAEYLSNKHHVLPEKIKADASDYYDLSKPHGKVLKKAIQNTINRIGFPDDIKHKNNQNLYGDVKVLKYLYGEFMVQAEAKHIIAVAENKISHSSDAYTAVGNVAAHKKPLLDEIKKQADGNYSEMEDYTQNLIKSDINTHYTKPEDLTEMLDIKTRYEKRGYIDIDSKHNLDFKEDINIIVVNNMIKNDQSLKNEDVDWAIRSIYAKVIAPIKLENTKENEKVYDNAYKQFLMAGARVINLGSNVTSKQAVSFMLNDMEIMKTCQEKDAGGYLHIINMDDKDRSLMAKGKYSKICENLKKTVHYKLMSQDYIAPGLMQQVSKHIYENENIPRQLEKNISTDNIAYQNSIMQVVSQF